MCVKRKRAKFQLSNARGTVLNIGLNEGGRKFNGKTGHISETVRDTAKVAINH